MSKQKCKQTRKHKHTPKKYQKWTKWSDHITQDKINFGIKSDELETILMSFKMGEAKKDFDILFEHNTKIYLNQCLIFAYDNNATLQSQVKQYFDTNDKWLYQCAPCIVK